MAKGTSLPGIRFEVRLLARAVNSFDQRITPKPSMSSGIIRFIGLFFPVFYLQLYAITRGVDPELAFYAVSRSVMCFSPSIWAFPRELLALGSQRSQHLGSHHTRRNRTQSWSIQPRSGVCHWDWSHFSVNDSSERPCWNDDIRYSHWSVLRGVHCPDACYTR